jgi:hypothetical protein
MRNGVLIGVAALVALTASSVVAQNPTTAAYFEPSGTSCSGGVNSEEAKKVDIKTELYTAGMISADSAKAIALCWVPGQISSGEMESNGTRTVYEIAVLPTDKKTYSKVIIDANTGQVLSTKQFGGARGYLGFLRESAERRKNKAKSP